jgi:hypothetical protein
MKKKPTAQAAFSDPEATAVEAAAADSIAGVDNLRAFAKSQEENKAAKHQEALDAIRAKAEPFVVKAANALAEIRALRKAHGGLSRPSKP